MAEPDSPAQHAPPSRLARLAGDFLAILRFYTRFHVPVFAFEADPHAAPDFNRAAFALPLVGVLVGLAGAAGGGMAYLLGLSTTLGAILAVGCMVIVTGAFHEDGFADTCDGLFGGTTPERRIEIMRDSRIGTYGAAGLMLALLIRIFALAELFRLIGPAGLPIIIGVAAAARPLALLPALWLQPAASGGLGRSVAMPGSARALLVMGLGCLLALMAAWPSDLAIGMLTAFVVALAGLYTLTRLAAARIGGYTGDIMGAAVQIAEMAMLLTLSAAASWHGPL